MKLSENFDKVFWTVFDKILYIVYGFVSLIQIRMLEPSEYGLFAILISIHTWIYVICDSFFLQSIIQFGFNPEKEKRTNFFALIFTLLFVAVFNSLFWIFKNQLSIVFNEANLIKVFNALPLLSFVTIPRVFALKFVFKHSSMLKLFIVNLAFFGTMTIHTFYLIFTNAKFNFHLMVDIYLLGTIISSIVSLLLNVKQIKLSPLGSISFKEFFNFGFSILGLSLVQSIPKQLDVLFLQYFFQSKIVGIYYSAKTLFRVFEEGMNAAFSLVYPTAVRLINKGKSYELESLLNKAVSFTFIVVLFLFIVLQLGGTKFIIELFLPEKYFQAISFFNIFLIASIFMPIQVIASIVIAVGKPQIVFKYITVSTVVFVLIFSIIGAFKAASLVPFALVGYYFTFAFFLFLYGRKYYNFSISKTLSALKDIKGFIQQVLNRTKSQL